MFLGKTSTIHIEFWFEFVPAKSSWTDLSLVWFAGTTPDGRCRGFPSPVGKRPITIIQKQKLFRETSEDKNGALDPWSLDLCLGHPRFLPRIAPKPFKIRVLGPLDWKSGRPKNADSTTMDPTPDSRPSENKIAAYAVMGQRNRRHQQQANAGGGILKQTPLKPIRYTAISSNPT